MTTTWNGEDQHPLDVVEGLAKSFNWNYSRIGDDQASMSSTGIWYEYPITMGWSESNEKLRFMCTFELTPSISDLDDLHEMLNLVNDETWGGKFTYWSGAHQIVYRYDLGLAGGLNATGDQIGQIIADATAQCDRFYPAFRAVARGESSIEEAMLLAMAEAYGNA